MRPRFPKPLNIILICLGSLAIGARAADTIPPTPTDTTTVVAPGRTVTSTRTVRRVVKGKLVRVDDKVFVTVPLVVVHVDHRTIRVPAHRLPLRSASAVVANPLVTVYIPVSSTVFVPTTITETLPASTETVTIPTTITLPLIPTTSDQ